MKKLIILLIACCPLPLLAQSEKDREQVKSACMDYIQGFYEGDTVKIMRSLKPSLYKFGYWKNNKSNTYESDGQMTYQQAIDYTKSVLKKKNFAKPDAPREVQVLDIMNHIASAKVTAWWGVDYILLSKDKDKWVIEQVLWEGPLEKKN